MGGAAQLLGEHVALLHVLRQEQLDVDRQPDRARLVGEGAHHRLADPPGGVGREARAAVGLELARGVQQPDVAFLDQVEQGEPAVEIAAGDPDDEPQVGLDEPLLGLGVAGLDAAGQVLLLLRGQQLDPGDLLQVERDQLAAAVARLGGFGLLAELGGVLVQQGLEGLVAVLQLIRRLGLRSHEGPHS